MGDKNGLDEENVTDEHHYVMGAMASDAMNVNRHETGVMEQDVKGEPRHETDAMAPDVMCENHYGQTVQNEKVMISMHANRYVKNSMHERYYEMIANAHRKSGSTRENRRRDEMQTPPDNT